MSNLRLGIAGCPRGSAFVEAARLAGFDVVAAMDPKPETLVEFCTKFDLPKDAGSSRFEDLIASGIGAVVIASPMPFHTPQAIHALAAGVHVLSEVTAAVSLDQALRLRDAVRASQAAYMMAENYVYRKPCQIVKAMARAGAFGELYYGEGQYLHEIRGLAKRPDGSTTWRMRWQMARRGVTYPSHSIGPVLDWMDDRVVSISARGTCSRVDNYFEGDDSAVMLCQTSRGGVVEIRTDLRSPRPHCFDYYQVQGTRGCYEGPRAHDGEHKVYLEGRHQEVRWYPLSDFEDEFLPDDWRAHEEQAAAFGHGGGDLIELFDFARACNGETPAIDIYKALDWTLPGLISELSVERGGEALPVPDPRTEELGRAAEEERGSGRFAGFVESI